MKVDRRFVGLALAAFLSSVASVALLAYLGWGYYTYRDMWDISRFATLLVGSVATAIAGVVACEGAARGRPGTAPLLIGFLAFVTRTVFAFAAVVFLLCNAGPVRGVMHAVMMRVVVVGMARDLPPPPASGSLPPG